MVEPTDQAKRLRLSELLIELVGQRNWSANELAKQLDISPPTARTYLQATGFPTEPNRGKIAELLNITYDELQAELNNEPLEEKQKSVDYACQLARSLSLKDFIRLAETVHQRELQELGQMMRLQLGDSSDPP